MDAFCLTRPYVPFGSVYPIRDAEIIACNKQAAHILGYDAPDLVVGKMLSDTQPLYDRQLGRAAYVLRGRQVEIPKIYCTRVERPDGEVITVRKEVLGTQMRSKGQDVMLTRMELVTEACDDLPDPAKHISDDEVRQRIGYTIREARDKQIQNILHISDNIRMLLCRYADLLSSVDGPLFTWSRSTDHISRRFTCPACGWTWYGALGTKLPQCSQCRKQPGRKWNAERRPSRSPG